MTEQIIPPEMKGKYVRLLRWLLISQGILLVVAVVLFGSVALYRQMYMPIEETAEVSEGVVEDVVEGELAEVEEKVDQAVIVHTNQTTCYNNSSVMPCPSTGDFYGQDGNYLNNMPSYTDSGDKTVTDQNTGLMWTQEYFGKMTFDEGAPYASSLDVGGYSDWRVPSIKELYSLIDFNGNTGSAAPEATSAPSDAVPYLNDDVFDFAYGLSSERYIDSQWLTTAKYVSTTIGGAETMFGVNFADGRIKGYGLTSPNPAKGEKEFYARFVRGDVYGVNDFVDNGDGTVTDKSTGLMWTRQDSGRGMPWKEALAYCETNATSYGDWRLPNVKGLQYIVDYTRSPDTSNSPAIDPVFESTQITNEAGQVDWAFYWTGTTHLDGPNAKGAYVSFGRAMGYMDGSWQDVHGAGAQRSDPKTGDASNYPQGHGPQGDAIRIDNMVRCVRDGN